MILKVESSHIDFDLALRIKSKLNSFNLVHTSLFHELSVRERSISGQYNLCESQKLFTM